MRSVSILDGDTIEVLHNQRRERIRRNSINSPDKDADEYAMDSVWDGSWPREVQWSGTVDQGLSGIALVRLVGSLNRAPAVRALIGGRHIALAAGGNS